MLWNTTLIIRNQHRYSDKRDRLRRDGSNTLRSDSLGSGGEAGAEISGSCVAIDGSGFLLLDGLIQGAAAAPG